MSKKLLGLALGAALSAAPASAATLYVGHGIPAGDGLPVDICLVADGTATLLFGGVTFGQFASVNDLLGVEHLDAGRYDVEVRKSNGSCTDTVYAAASLFLGIGENATAFAHLTEQGTPTITKYVNDFRALGEGQTRIYARHAASAGDVNVFLRKGYKRAAIRGLENPDQEGADLPAGKWFVGIYAAGSWKHPLFSAKLPLAAGMGYFAYAVGSPADGTFEVLLQPLPIH